MCYAASLFSKIMKAKNTSFRQRVIAMNVGDTIVISVDIHRGQTVRNYASTIGFEMGRKYTTICDRVARTYTIRREA